MKTSINIVIVFSFFYFSLYSQSKVNLDVNINTCKCKFEWLSISGFLYKGKIFYKKNIGIRIELKKPPGKIIIANTRHFIVVDQSEQIIGIQRLKKRKDFSGFLGILQLFTPKRGKRGLYWEREKGTWRSIHIKAKDGFPSLIEILTINGITKIWFKNVKLNIRLEDNLFFINHIPKNYQIIPNPYEEEKIVKEIH